MCVCKYVRANLCSALQKAVTGRRLFFRTWPPRVDWCPAASVYWCQCRPEATTYDNT